MIISPAKRLEGTVELPGDKSISHRAAMFAAIAAGTSVISNYASGADCASTLSALSRLGVNIEVKGSAVTVHGAGLRGLTQPSSPVDCGNSGTTIRLLSGILAGQGFESVLVGDESLSRRPMKRIIGPLEQMGCRIESTEGHAPLTINSNERLRSIDFELPVASAQLKSCVLLAGLNADGITRVFEPVPTRDHTERMLRGFGVEVLESEDEGRKVIAVRGDQGLQAVDISVPGDISSSAFFLVAAACLPGSKVRMPNVGINPTRDGIVRELRRFGADIEIDGEIVSGGEPIGKLNVSGGVSNTAERNVIAGQIVANLIDEVPILAVFGTQLEGGLEIRDAGELRVKESDRITAISHNLRRMGADVEEFPDGLRVERTKLKGADVESFGDHRIAMAFAVAGLLAEGDTKIAGADAADVSFPGFYETLNEIARR